MKIQQWCPNCHYFYKELGMNYCHLADGHEGYSSTGCDQLALAWLQDNQTDSGAILPDSDDCPRFIPFAELAQKAWAEHHGVSMTDAQLHWLKVTGGAA